MLADQEDTGPGAERCDRCPGLADFRSRQRRYAAGLRVSDVAPRGLLLARVALTGRGRASSRRCGRHKSGDPGRGPRPRLAQCLIAGLRVSSVKRPRVGDVACLRADGPPRGRDSTTSSQTSHVSAGRPTSAPDVLRQRPTSHVSARRPTSAPDVLRPRPTSHVSARRPTSSADVMVGGARPTPTGAEPGTAENRRRLRLSYVIAVACSDVRGFSVPGSETDSQLRRGSD